jgi:Spy/CpxP family protein refolding chaperone
MIRLGRTPRHFHRRPVTWLAAICALLAVTSAVVTGQAISPKRSRWWKDPAIQRQLALSTEQIDRLEAIFNRDLPVRIELYNKITRLDAELRRTIELGEVDDNTLMRLIDEVETVRRQRDTRRHLMLLAMYKVLTPSQRSALASRSRRSRFTHP